MNCREKRRKAGLPYSRSSCARCGSLLRPGWSCAEEISTDVESLLQRLKAERATLQAESDLLLDKVVQIRHKIKSMNMEINKAKRLVNEDSKKDERRRTG